MSTDVKKLLARATKRPWAQDDDYLVAVNTAGQSEIAEFFKADGGDGFLDPAIAKANAELALIAVNSYEADHELIRKLTEALLSIHPICCDSIRHTAAEYYECRSNPGQCPAVTRIAAALKAAQEGAK